MDYSAKSLTESAKVVREPLAGAGVLNVVQPGKGDFSDWVELMEVVEALCAEWPVALKRQGNVYKL